MAQPRKRDPRPGVRLGVQGRVVIPARARKAAGIKAGDRLHVWVEDGIVMIGTRERLLDRLRAQFPAPDSGKSLADELIAERRAEATREDESPL